MKRLLSSLIALPIAAGFAVAGSFTNLNAYADADARAEVDTNIGWDDQADHHYNAGDSFIVSALATATRNDQWVKEIQVYLGDDEWGNPIYDTQYEDQQAYAWAQATSSASFAGNADALSSAVDSFQDTDSFTLGSDAWATAGAYSWATITIEFTLDADSWLTLFHLDSDFAFYEVYRNDEFLFNTKQVGDEYWSSQWVAGDYRIEGGSGAGGAQLSLSGSEAVPEPMSLAAVGFGLAALIRKRRSG